LLAALARRCIENGWTRFEWSVLDWNAPSIAFYKSLGAVLLDDWTICRVGGEALRDLGSRGAPS
jgi:RimJ/RimL family protein N-acetyltransferase